MTTATTIDRSEFSSATAFFAACSAFDALIFDFAEGSIGTPESGTPIKRRDLIGLLADVRDEVEIDGTPYSKVYFYAGGHQYRIDVSKEWESIDLAKAHGTGMTR